MKEKFLSIQKHCGVDRVSRDDGLRMREWIIKQWNKNDRIVFDFENILIASVSFLDEAFAKLAFDYSKDELVKKLKFENLQHFDRALLNDLVRARIKEMEIKNKNGKDKHIKSREAKQSRKVRKPTKKSNAKLAISDEKL